MVSQIDANQPPDGQLVNKGLQRQNNAFARDEIEALQALDVAVRAALGLGASDNRFPELGGTNTPTGEQTLPTIILALDTALEVVRAIANAGGGGALSLGDITDILSPTEAIRAAFANPLNGITQQNDFAFDLGSQGGRFITADNSLNSVTMTLPDTSVLSARDDGFLCELVPASGANFCSIAGPTDSLRFQRNFFGDVITQTTVFVGLSRTSSFRSVMRVYKDGPIYHLVGPGRVTEANDERFGAPGTLNADVLQALSLLDATFPNLLNLGGTKQAGGARGIMRDENGNHTLLQTDAGVTLVHTGAGASTWDVPQLLSGSTIDIVNDGGDITFNVLSSQTPVGGLTLQGGSDGAVRWLPSGRVKFVGTIV